MSLVTDHLTSQAVPFEVLEHRRVFTSMDEAGELAVAPDEVAKTVAVRSHGGYVVAVLPASQRLGMRRVHHLLDDPAARLATEAELRADFPDYELGALPPLAALLKVRVLVDPEVLEHEQVVFAAGSETASVRARTADLFPAGTVTIAPITRESEPTGAERWPGEP